MSDLRVVVDAHMVGHRETGNETYIVGLLAGLSELPRLRVAAAVDPDASLPRTMTDADLELVPLETRGNWSRLGWGLDRLCRKWRGHLLHTSYIAPLRSVCPFVVTVHDVSFRRFPEFFSARDRCLFATLLPHSLKRAAAVLTDSRHARQEIATFYPTLGTPVIPIALGVGPEFSTHQDAAHLDAVRVRHGTGRDYILAVGNLQPRKNLNELVRAFGLFREQFPELRLVIVGQAQWRASPLFELVDTLGLQSCVVFPGYVPAEDLPALFKGARLFIYPSTYEGFGLPVLEAMASGTPVVAVNTSSIPEVAGDAALLADSPKAPDLASSILRVLNDESLARKLGGDGRQRAERFSWTETARRTRDVYEKVVAGSL